MIGRRREYRRLPGRSRSWFRVSTTWIGADHLLLVDRHLFVEGYRRVYFHDVQAILTRPTPTYLFGCVVLLLWSLLMIGLTLSVEGRWRTFWAVPAGAVVAAFLVHLVRGPTWRCHLRTPLQLVELRAQRRRRLGERALRRLRPLLEERQGRLTREEILVAIAAAPEGGGSASPRPHPAPVATDPAVPPPIARRENGLLASLLVLGLLLEAGISALQVSFRDPLFNLAAIALFLAEVGLAIAVATRRGGRGAAATLRLFGWATLVFQITLFVVGGVVGVVRVLAAGLRAAQTGAEAPFEAYTLASQPGGLVLASIVGSLGLAAWGLFLLRRLKAENEDLWLNLKDSPDGAA